MKISQLFLLAFLIPFTLGAQIPGQEYIYSEAPWSTVNTGLKIGSDTYFGGSDHLCKAATVTRIGANDNLIFRTSLENGYWEVGDLIYQENENRLLGCGFYSSSDDFPDGNLGPTIFAINLNGDLLFQTILDENTYGNLGTEITELTYTLNGDIVMATKDKLLWFDQSGTYQNAQIISAGPDVLGIKRVNDDKLLSYSSSGFFVMDHEGQILESISVTLGLVSSVFVSDNIVYTLTNNGLFTYSLVDQSTANHTDFLNYISVPEGICGNAEKLFIYEKSNPDTDYEKVITLNKSTFVLEADYFFEQAEVSISDVFSNEEELLFVGNYFMSEENPTFPMYPYIHGSQSFIKSTLIADAPTFSSADISLSNLVITDPLIPVDTIEDYPGFYQVWFDSPYAGFSFDITNNGDNIVHSFSVTSNRWWSFNCAESRYFKHFTNIAIFPGETMTFSDSTWIINYIPEGSDLPEITLIGIGPNHHFDGDYSNNYISQLVVYVSADEPLFSSKINLFPNPAANYIQLEADLEVASNEVLIEVFDPLGKKHKQLVVAATNSRVDQTLYVGDLGSGMYLVQLSANGRKHVEWVVIY